MFYDLKEIQKYNITGLDGHLGQIDTCLFDDVSWKIIYFVIDTSNWLFENRVLIKPENIVTINMLEKKMITLISKQEIENSLDLDTINYATKQKDRQSEHKYVWPVPAGKSLEFPSILKVEKDYDIVSNIDHGNHLRSSKAIFNYNLEAKDCDIGQINDIIINDQLWTVSYLLIETQNLLIDKSVLLSPNWIDKISWDQKKVILNMNIEKIANAPSYDQGSPITKEYVEKLLRYFYGKT
jgi:hypothetical protein